MTDWETRYYEAEALHTESNGMLTAENATLRQHAREQFDELAQARTYAEQLRAALRRIDGYVSWRVCPDAGGKHHVLAEHMEAMREIVEAALATNPAPNREAPALAPPESGDRLRHGSEAGHEIAREAPVCDSCFNAARDPGAQNGDECVRWGCSGTLRAQSGTKCVPAEATEEMCDAALNRARNGFPPAILGGEGYKHAAALWRAMHDAAPDVRHQVCNHADLIKAVRWLTFVARTSGGVAGRDETLCAVLDVVESLLPPMVGIDASDGDEVMSRTVADTKQGEAS